MQIETQQDENSKIEVDLIEYSINEKERTASIITNISPMHNIFIPRSITYQSQEYLITSISTNAFKCSKEVKSIQFASDSELHTIEENAFVDSSIQSLSIPSSVTELKKGWCNRTKNLTKIEILSNNNRYTIFDDKFILGKSKQEKEYYDILVFSVRDIQKVEIPSFIEIIGSHAFDFCNQLQQVKFSKGSKLRIIDESAFSNSSINNISIPPHVTKICENAFSANNLQKIEFPTNSELYTIEKNAFFGSLFESIQIPSSVVELNEGWCGYIQNLTKITVMPENKCFKIYDNKFLIGKSSLDDDIYDRLILSVRDIETASIPDFIKKIEAYAFSDCKKLKTIEFSENSELEIISENAFFCSSIEKICIPPHVKIIKESAFDGCTQLREVEIPKNSSLQTIENDAFLCSQIERLIIPSNLVDLKEYWCKYIPKLNKITVMPDNERYAFYDDKYLIGKSTLEKEDYDVLVFSVRNIQIAVIPDFIEIIGPCAFSNCDQLQQVITTKNSKLKTIENNAFQESSIQRISIPTKLIKIGEYAFYLCQQLRQVEIPDDSLLEEIGEFAFYNCDLHSFSITPNITHINKGTFFSCNQLQKIEIPENSNLKVIEKDAFYNSSIEEITFPSNLAKINESWCCCSPNITKFRILPGNKHFISYENKYILGKSSPYIENFDVLVFSVRDIEIATIPSFIKIIGSNAFDSCKNLQRIEFSQDSNLEIIDSNAFLNSSIQYISIPYHVTHLKYRTFFMAYNIRCVEIPTNSEIQIIEHETFAHSKIKSFVIPPKIKQISTTAFLSCNDLQIVEINDNSKLQYIESNLFRNQTILFIPPKLNNLII